MSEFTRTSSDVAGIILAGGRSRRMGGRDKAFLQVDGETVLERTLRVLRACFDEVLVVCNEPRKFERFAVDVVTDELRDLGPLGGLHAGLGRVRAPYAFVTACDMPFLRHETISFLVERLRDREAEPSEAVVPCWDGDIEPLHAIYAAHLRSRIEAAINDGARSMRDFLPLVDALYVPERIMAGVGGAEESFRNVNTPEEAARFSVDLVG